MKWLILLFGIPFSVYAVSETLIVERASYPEWFVVEAEIEAVNESTVSAQTNGWVEQIFFDVNDYVEKGQLIIQLRDKLQKAALDQANAQLSSARALNQDASAQLKRAEPLVTKGSISEDEFDSIKAQGEAAEAAVVAAKARVEVALEQLSYTKVRAPYSGIVKARLIENGEGVVPGTPLMTGLSLSKVRAVATIPQKYSSYYSNNSLLQRAGSKEPKFQGAVIEVTTQNQTWTVKEFVLFPYADPDSHSFQLRADIQVQEGALFPGMWVKLKVPIGEKLDLRIPRSALLRRGPLTQVFVESDLGPQLRVIRLGQQFESEVQVLSGIYDGESVLLHPYDYLSEAGVEE